MAFMKDFTDSLMEKAKKVSFFRKDGDNSRGTMPNGGTTGYYPDTKARDLFAEPEQPVEQPVQQPQQQNGPVMGAQQQYQQPQQQAAKDPVSAYTSSFGGFATATPEWQYGTGRQTPVSASAGWTGYQQPVNNAQQANPAANTGWTGYQQPVNNAQQVNPAGNTGWTGYQQPVNNAQQANPAANTGWTGYQQSVNNAQQANPAANTGWTGYQQSVNNAQQEAEQHRARRTGKRQQRENQPQQSNITYMNNGGTNFVDESGSAYIHTERVIQMVNVEATFRVIDFMRNNESIIVNVEGIANETETQRCLDLLVGAAFTMGCSMTKITQFKHAYLFAPRSVLVLADDSVKGWMGHGGVYDQRDAAGSEQYRPVSGAYTPDRPDEQRRDMYQEQQERMQRGYTGQQRAYAQNGYTGQQRTYAQNGYTGQQQAYTRNG